jgi:hypothetical protein
VGSLLEERGLIAPGDVPLRFELRGERGVARETQNLELAVRAASFDLPATIAVELT